MKVFIGAIDLLAIIESGMKLAEALMVRADMQKKVAKLRERIAKCAIIDKGDKPAEDPDALLRQALGLTEDMRALIVRINATNSRVTLKGGRTLMEAIAQREAWSANHKTLQAAIAALDSKLEPYSMREIKRVAVLDVAKLHKQADDLAKKVRELNVQIQEANWEHELED